MDNDILAGMWKQVKGQVKQTWGELTDDEIDQINGQREKLAGKLQEKYGYTKQQAEYEIAQFLKNTEAKLNNNPDYRAS